MKYPYNLTIVHNLERIANPLELIIASERVNSKDVLQDILTKSFPPSKGQLLELVTTDGLVDAFISADLILNGIVTVALADLHEDDKTLFEELVNA